MIMMVVVVMRIMMVLMIMTMMIITMIKVVLKILMVKRSREDNKYFKVEICFYLLLHVGGWWMYLC